MTEAEHAAETIMTAASAGSGDTPAVRRAAASFDDLMKKKRRSSEFVIPTVGDDNERVELVMRYRAIGSSEYDQMVSAHPPTTAQKKDGHVYNPDTFAPALVAAVSFEPKLTREQAQALLTSAEWSGGEVMAIFMNAMRLQNAGLDVPFTDAG